MPSAHWKLLLLFGLGTLAGVGAAAASNQNVTCVFKNVQTAYQRIAGLGAMPAPFYESNATLTSFCKNSSNLIAFNSSLDSIPYVCKTLDTKIPQSLKDVEVYVASICTNGTEFLNNTKCYNNQQRATSKCYADNDVKGKNTTKALCCSVINTKKCISKLIKKSCSKKESSFRDDMLNTYSRFSNSFCSQFANECGGVAEFKSSLTGLLSAFAVIAVSWNVLKTK